MSLPTQHRKYCVQCKAYIETIRISDENKLKDQHVISHSLCVNCKDMFWEKLLQKYTH